MLGFTFQQLCSDECWYRGEFLRQGRREDEDLECQSGPRKPIQLNSLGSPEKPNCRKKWAGEVC
jgi:hypothetical protein